MNNNNNNNQNNALNIRPLMDEVQTVLQTGVNQLLSNFIERYEMLEQTHQQLMALPSIQKELGSNTSSSISISPPDHNRMAEFEKRMTQFEEDNKSIVVNLQKLVETISSLSTIVLSQQPPLQESVSADKMVFDTLEDVKLLTVHDSEEMSEEDDCASEKAVSEEEQEEDTIADMNENEVVVEEEEVVEKEQEVAEGVAEEEEEEEEEEVVEEEEVEEEEEEEEEEDEVVQKEVVEEASIETETREESEDETDDEEPAPKVEEPAPKVEEPNVKEEDEDEEELFEIEIDDKTYCTNDDQNGTIWVLTEEGEQGDKIGYFKDGEVIFFEDEN